MMRVMDAGPSVTASQTVKLPVEEVLQKAIKRGVDLLARRGRKFVIDSDNEKLFEYLALYFARDESFPGDLYKGIMLRGDCGVGKSFPLTCFSGITSPVSYQPEKIVSCIDLLNIYQNKGPEGLSPYEFGVIVLDELSEKHDASHYGNVQNVIQNMLELRYNYYVRTGKVMHVTTNLKNLKSIDMHYGARVYSRVHEMFNIKNIEGKDRRL